MSQTTNNSNGNFKEDEIYRTRCPKCFKLTRYQKYRYMAEDHRGLPCEFCKQSPPFLAYFRAGLIDDISDKDFVGYD